jgi:hypothetical protein
MRGEVLQGGHAKCSEVAGGDIKHGVGHPVWGTGMWAAGPLCGKSAWRALSQASTSLSTHVQCDQRLRKRYASHRATRLMWSHNQGDRDR